MNIRKYSLDFILNGDFENNNFYICCLVKYFYLRLCKCVYICISWMIRSEIYLK